MENKINTTLSFSLQLFITANTTTKNDLSTLVIPPLKLKKNIRKRKDLF